MTHNLRTANQLRATIVDALAMKDYARATRTLLSLGVVEQERMNNPLGAFPYVELALEVASRTDNTDLLAEVEAKSISESQIKRQRSEALQAIDSALAWVRPIQAQSWIALLLKRRIFYMPDNADSQAMIRLVYEIADAYQALGDADQELSTFIEFSLLIAMKTKDVKAVSTLLDQGELRLKAIDPAKLRQDTESGYMMILPGSNADVQLSPKHLSAVEQWQAKIAQHRTWLAQMLP